MGKIQRQHEAAAVKAYLHQIFLRPASGEYALNTILSVGSWARNPLIKRMPELKMKIAFFYGDIDWMNPSGALELIEKS